MVGVLGVGLLLLLAPVDGQVVYTRGFGGISASSPTGTEVFDDTALRSAPLDDEDLVLAWDMSTVNADGTLFDFSGQGHSGTSVGTAGVDTTDLAMAYDGAGLITGGFSDASGNSRTGYSHIGRCETTEQHSPLAYYYEGQFRRTYIGGCISDNATAMGFQYDHDTKSLVDVVISDNPVLVQDNHDSAVILALNNGTLVTFYSHHNGADMFYKFSSEPEDITTFGNELIHPGSGAQNTYPKAFQLNTNNRLYLIWRDCDSSGSCNITMSNTTDLTSWTTRDKLLWSGINDETVYPVMAEDDETGKIHLFWTNAGFWQAETDLLYTFVQDGNFHTADGTVIKAVADGPLLPGEAEIIWDASVRGNRSFVFSAAIDSSGRPAVIFPVGVSPTDSSDAWWWYARWTGIGWVDSPITKAGRQVSGNNLYHGASIESPDIFTVYVGKEDAGTRSIERYKSTDGGGTWSQDALVASFSDANRKVHGPSYVINNSATADFEVTWFYGRYDNFNDFEMYKVGVPLGREVGAFGSAITFNGVDDWVNTAFDLSSTTWTFTTYLNFDDSPGTTYTVAGKRESGNEWWLHLRSTKVMAFSMWDSGDVLVLDMDSTTLFEPAVTYHFSARWDGAEACMLVNGTEDVCGTPSATPADTSGFVSIGGNRNEPSDRYMKGWQDEMAFFERAVSDPVISTISTRSIASFSETDPVTVPTRFGAGVRLDNPSRVVYVTTPHTPNLDMTNSSVTLVWWGTFHESGRVQWIMGKQFAFSQAYGFRIDATDEVELVTRNAVANPIVQTGFTITAGVQYAFGVTWTDDGADTTVRFYTGGTLQHTAAGNARIGDSGDPFRIGRTGDSDTNTWANVTTDESLVFRGAQPDNVMQELTTVQSKVVIGGGSDIVESRVNVVFLVLPYAAVALGMGYIGYLLIQGFREAWDQ